MTASKGARIAATGARVVIGAAVSAACVFGVVVSVPASWPQVSSDPVSVEVTPVAGETVLSCAGPFRALGRDPLAPATVTSAGENGVTSAADDGDELDRSALATPGMEGGSGAPVLRAQADGRDAAQASASSSLRLQEGDLSGFAASACRAPSTESWIVGGAADTGTSDVLLLANPGEVPATTTLLIHGSAGNTSETEVIVPAGAEISVPLAASAVGDRSPVVRVSSTGAPVRAMLQSSLIRTLDPSGIDLQSSAGSPATSLSVLGVTVVAQGVADRATTVLRLLATAGEGTATATVRAADGTQKGEATTIPLREGVAVEVNLPLAPGIYSVDVEADTPVVGAVWQSTGQETGGDFAWMVPAPELAESTVFSVPVGPQPKLHVRNDSDADQTVILRSLSGKPAQEIELEAGRSAVVTVSEGESYALESEGEIRAAVSMSAADALAGWPIWPVAGSASPLVVYP